jgi:hypothetical protein
MAMGKWLTGILYLLTGGVFGFRLFIRFLDAQ